MSSYRTVFNLVITGGIWGSVTRGTAGGSVEHMPEGQSHSRGRELHIHPPAQQSWLRTDPRGL